LACAVIKARRFEWVLEKSVELGAHEIWPLLTEHGVILPGPGRQSRWRTILRTALKQTGRAYLPRLRTARDLPLCLREWGSGGSGSGSALLYYGDCPVSQGEDIGRPALTAAHTLLSTLLSRNQGHAVAATDQGGAADPGSPPASLIWCAGPEGGWSPAERELLVAAGGSGITCGPHRQRTETAAAGGLWLLQLLRSCWLDTE
jgi:16S rRNA (uracil1498-N3)-methyltransferase